MAQVLSVSNDLMLGSRVEATLTAAGHGVKMVGSVEPGSLEGVELIVADLDSESPDNLVGLGVPVLAYYSHVDVATREAAVAAGVDQVVPRSRMARELPALVDGLLGR